MSAASLSIRRAEAGDAAAISALTLRAVRISNAPDYAPDIIACICEAFTPSRIVADLARRDVFVATTGAEIVGTVSLGGGKLHSLFVEPERQGTGIGVALVAHLEEHARHAGLRALRLSASLTARRFYAGRGYRELEVETQRAFTTVLMEKELSAPRKPITIPPAACRSRLPSP